VITNLQNLKPGSAFRVFQMPDLSGVLVDVNECSAKVKLVSGSIDVEIAQPDGNVRRFNASQSRTVIWSPATVIETIDASAALSPPAQPDAEPAEVEASNLENETMKTVTKAKKTPKAAKEPQDRKPKATNMTKGGGTRVRSSAKTTAVGTPAPKEVTDELDKAIETLTEQPVPSKAKKSASYREHCQEIMEFNKAKPASEPKKLKDHPKPKAKTKLSLLDIAAEVLSDGKPRNCDQIITEVLARGDWQTSGKTPAATLYSGLIREINNSASKPSRFERTATKGEFKCK